MPENKNIIFCTTNALTYPTLLPKTTYRKIRRCFSFRKGIFGQRLEETVRYERRYGMRLAPTLVEQCADFIRQRGLKEEGLFRLPGQANLVKELQEAFDCGEKPLFDSNTDVHTVASLLKLYLRELPEPVIPYAKYDEFLLCAKLLTKEQETGMKELIKQVKTLPPVNFNLLKYICRFLDEVQSYSDVNKMSVQNLGTVFGPNILRPKVEDPVTIMEGTILVQQLMSVFISEHKNLFPKDGEEIQGRQDGCNNNNEVPKKSLAGFSPPVNKENKKPFSEPVRQCSWDNSESPKKGSSENGGSPTTLNGGNKLSSSPRSSLGKVDVNRSPPITVKKNPAYSKGSGIVTNGSFSSPVETQEKIQALPNGSLQARRNSSLKGMGTKLGTGSMQNGGVRMGVSSADVLNSSLNNRVAGWLPNGYVTLRDSKAKDAVNSESMQHHRLSTYDNVQLQFSASNSDDKQSVDSATWSTSSCEIPLMERSTSCRSSTTTCPDQDSYEDPALEGPVHETSFRTDSENKYERSGAGGCSSRATSSSDNSDTFVSNASTGNHSALHSLVASLKQEVTKQKIEYEARIKSLEQRNLELESEVMTLHEELDQERKKYTMVEIKMRNTERAREDAEKRNEMLQKEMEQFFSTFGDLTVETRRSDRSNTIWIQ
ncbi:rho GTPase-activating protein 24 isoform X2 [Hypanus sabinus]|uniref:rho GTPase-activating protein 24 isoform X2 n=1 Tax=Hypanus sabinus TaxID=79690 RepID=UPI0028C3E7C6|nr:rho GTPase-activating protein 24 isoform X2 [Hypanus sabinus]